MSAIYKRGWTLVAVPNHLLVAQVRTDALGRFRIVTNKRVDGLLVHYYFPSASIGFLDDVAAEGNVMRIFPLPTHL